MLVQPIWKYLILISMGPTRGMGPATGRDNEDKRKKAIADKRAGEAAEAAEKKEKDREDRKPKVDPPRSKEALAKHKSELKELKRGKAGELSAHTASIARELQNPENVANLQIEIKRGKCSASLNGNPVKVIAIEKEWQFIVKPSEPSSEQPTLPTTYLIIVGSRTILLHTVVHTGPGTLIATTADEPRVPITMGLISTFGEVFVVQGSQMKSDPSILKHFTLFCNRV